MNLGIGRSTILNGSNVIVSFLQFKHVKIFLYCPYVKSTKNE